MSTAALIKSINEHASRQHQQLREIQADMEVLARALAHIVRLGSNGSQEGDSNWRIRCAMTEIAREAILEVMGGSKCEPL